jgi:flavin-dependent dehydrogenase
VILVGEAAGIDFPTGEGIAQALAYGAVAAPYLADALARDRLELADWRAHLLACAEGRFLHRRWLAGRVLFSRARPAIERALVRSPRVFGVALRRFAGKRISKRELGAAITQLGLGLASTLL